MEPAKTEPESFAPTRSQAVSASTIEAEQPSKAFGRYTAGYFLRGIKDVIDILAPTMVVLGTLGALFIWLTSGIQTHAQIQEERLSEQLQQLSGSLEKMSIRVEQLPRAADYTDLVTRLLDMEHANHEISGRLIVDEINMARIEGRVPPPPSH